MRILLLIACVALAGCPDDGGGGGGGYALPAGEQTPGTPPDLDTVPAAGRASPPSSGNPPTTSTR